MAQASLKFSFFKEIIFFSKVYKPIFF